MRLLSLAFLGMAAVLVFASTPAPIVAAAPIPVPISARFLFDLGDGAYSWANETIPDPSANNATWNATLAAASSAGLWVTWSWYSGFGVFIEDVGNRSPPSGVGVYTWNATAHAWDASVGISSLVLRQGDIVAVDDAGYGPPPTYATQYPVPTPDDPYPVLEFRGDFANTGKSRSAAPDSAGVLWDRDLNLQEIAATPAVAYGRVYVLTMDGMFALNRTTGKVLWSNPKAQGLSTPAVFNGTVLFGGKDGKVHALDAWTGTETWNTTLLTKTVFSGITSSPKVVFDTAYLGTFNETGGPGEVVALGVSNGTVIWRHPTASVDFSSPAVGNGTVFVGVMGRYNTTTSVSFDRPYGILALDAGSGTQRWFYATNGSVAASPVLAASEVIAPSKDGTVYALDAGTGRLRWRARVSAGVSSPALFDGTLYVGGGAFGTGGVLTALDASTGAPKWSFNANGPIQSSVTYADGKVFFSTNAADGTIYALGASSGALVWAYTPSPRQYIFGSPVVADGHVFAPSDNGHVYAFQDSPILLNLTVDAPSAVPLDGNVTINVTIRNVAGTARNVVLGFALTDLQVLAASPPIDRTAQGTVFWDLGTLAYGETRQVSLHVRGVCSSLFTTRCPGGSFQQWLTLLNANYAGVTQEPVSLRFNVTISGSAAGPADLTVPLLFLTAFGAVVVVLAFVIPSWRRRRAP